MALAVSPNDARRLLHEKTGLTTGLIGIRGYFASKGAPGNDRGIYDDLLIIVSPQGVWLYTANVDASIFREHIANLDLGTWWYKPGIHNLSKPADRRYPAFVQAKEVTVHRDGMGLDTGFFGINIHRGGVNSTSSEGCQTVPPAQWDAFHSKLIWALGQAKTTEFPYVLIDASSFSK